MLIDMEILCKSCWDISCQYCLIYHAVAEGQPVVRLRDAVLFFHHAVLLDTEGGGYED